MLVVKVYFTKSTPYTHAFCTRSITEQVLGGYETAEKIPCRENRYQQIIVS